jgi:hypothetical protein
MDQSAEVRIMSSEMVIIIADISSKIDDSNTNVMRNENHPNTKIMKEESSATLLHSKHHIHHQ